ncbi:MAG: transcriptional regulator containing an amidase domain and an AraC-type DNA-binding domain [Acidimicrobiales bacterium]|nr:transcriptional regulator containing an amidase domain and an AraC-type DNA-binding domain [Acidimicrobiales bacterium]
MQIAIGLYEGFTALDAIGPYQVFTAVPGVEVVLCAAQTGRLSDDNDLLHLDVEHTFAEVSRPDVLLVPGGFITRKLARDGDPIVDWVAAAHPHTTYTTSVCTGALVLGAAGILEGLDATTHWSAYDALAGYGATPTEQRVVQQGKVWTGAGVSAGIDLALTLLGEVFGPEMSQAVQLGIEYDPQPPYDAGSPSKAPADIVELVREVGRQKEAEILA